MAPRRLYLKDGVPAEQAERSLRPLITGASNVLAAGHGQSGHERLRNEYLLWTEQVEAQLQGLTLDAEALTMMQTERYWRIREMSQATTRPWPLVQSEIDIQKATLDGLLRDLATRVALITRAPGRVVVLDTNTLLQYLPFEQIPWLTIVGAPQVRLVVPLRVVEELDAKKYSDSKRLAERARGLLPRLEQTVLAKAGVVGEGVSIEVPVDKGPRRRPADADQEILDLCHEWRQLTGTAVLLVTADTGMRLRAHVRDIPVMRLPEEFERGQAGGSAPVVA